MLLENSSFMKDGNRITILRNNKLNFNGKVYQYKLTDMQRIQFLEWGDNREVVENGRVCGWDEELPLFNQYYMKEWQRFLYMFFRHHYQGDGDVEKGEMQTDVWRLWKEHYLNENNILLKSPRDRSSLKLTRSPTSSPLSSPSSSPRNSLIKRSSLRFSSERPPSPNRRYSDSTKSSPELKRYFSKE